MDEWKNGFDSRLSGISNQFEDARLSLESRYGEQIKEQLLSVQEKYREQCTRCEENIEKSDKEFAARMDSMEKMLHAFIDSQKNDIEEAKKAAEDYVKSELEQQGQSALEQLKRYERDIGAQLDQLGRSVAVTQEETNGSLESILGDISSWRERLNVQFEENRSLYTEKLNALQQTSDEQINQVKQMFASDIASFADMAKDERERITRTK